MRISDIFYFAQGYGRYFCVKVFGWGFLRDHIAEQILCRAISADKRCVCDGRCKICGCHTPALFYADKACDKPCYPGMMGKREWNEFMANGGNDDWIVSDGVFHKVKEVCDEEIF